MRKTRLIFGNAPSRPVTERKKLKETKMDKKQDERVAWNYIATYYEPGYEENIVIEYRYAYQEPLHESKNYYDLSVKIKGREYRISDYYYFSVMGELLDRLPISCAIKIEHPVLISEGSQHRIAMLEEWMRPYQEDRHTGGTVVYQLKLKYRDKVYETTGYYTDFGSVTEELQRQIGESLIIHACIYCKLMVIFTDIAGTDFRHDRLYCFRDDTEALEEINRKYPHLMGSIEYLARATAHLDALHSCSDFAFSKEKRI
jgi:hypothetical protein